MKLLASGDPYVASLLRMTEEEAAPQGDRRGGFVPQDDRKKGFTPQDDGKEALPFRMMGNAS